MNKADATSKLPFWVAFVKANAISAATHTDILAKYNGEFEGMPKCHFAVALQSKNAGIAFRASFFGDLVYILILLLTLGLAQIVCSLYFLIANRSGVHGDFFRESVVEILREKKAKSALEIASANPKRDAVIPPEQPEEESQPPHDPADEETVYVPVWKSVASPVGGTAAATQNSAQTSGSQPPIAPPQTSAAASAPGSGTLPTSGGAAPSVPAAAAAANAGGAPSGQSGTGLVMVMEPMTKGEAKRLPPLEWPYGTTFDCGDPYHRDECQALYAKFIGEFQAHHAPGAYAIATDESNESNTSCFGWLIDCKVTTFNAERPPLGEFYFRKDRLRGAIISTAGKLRHNPEDCDAQKMLRTLLLLYYNIDSVPVRALDGLHHAATCSATIKDVTARAETALKCAFMGINPFSDAQNELGRIAAQFVAWLMRNNPSLLLPLFRCVEGRLPQLRSGEQVSAYELLPNYMLSACGKLGVAHAEDVGRAEAVMHTAINALSMHSVFGHNNTNISTVHLLMLHNALRGADITNREMLPSFDFTGDRTVIGGTYSPLINFPGGKSERFDSKNAQRLVEDVCRALDDIPTWHSLVDDPNGRFSCLANYRPKVRCTRRAEKIDVALVTEKADLVEIASALLMLCCCATKYRSRPIADFIIDRLCSSVTAGGMKRQENKIKGATPSDFFAKLRGELEKVNKNGIVSALAYSGNGTIYEVEIRTAADGPIAIGNEIIILAGQKRYAIGVAGGAVNFSEVLSDGSKTPAGDTDPIRRICDGETTLFF
ncbi:MAG: hypothetical protein LBI39_00710 [Puniceicoccales bacterium]|nr:hypothetical protein [Puniceicoccales bacterium]